MYYYAYNLQGDVTFISDIYGNVVGTYAYDNWGKILAVNNAGPYTVATANPFRYRGYYYDVETGLYYLNSRYYNPEWGRFVNADRVIGGNVQGYNLFAYCFNNPVNLSDPSGNWPQWLKNLGNTIIDGIKSVGKFFNNNFGAQTITTLVEYEDTTTANFLFFKIKKSDSVSHDIEKGTSKTVTVYANTSSKKVGININTGNLSGDIGIGIDGLISENASLKVQETTYSFGFNEKILISDYTFSASNGNATTSYTFELNKFNIAAFATAPYLLPVGAGGKLIKVFS